MDDHGLNRRRVTESAKARGKSQGRFHRLDASPQQLNQRSDAYLVQVSLAGDHEGFRALLARHAGLVAAYVSAKLPAPEDAEDVLQETLLAAYRDLARLDKADRFGAWLLAIARMRVSDWYRRRAPESRDPEDAEISDGGRDAPAIGDDAAFEASVIDVLAAMKDKYRLPLQMKLFEELNATEIASRLNIRPGTARMRLHRGLEMLRQRLKRLGFEPGPVDEK